MNHLKNKESLKRVRNKMQILNCKQQVSANTQKTGQVSGTIQNIPFKEAIQYNKFMMTLPFTLSYTMNREPLSVLKEGEKAIK